MRLLGMLICVLFCCTRPAYGSINTGYSLEWLCTFRPTVVHVEVVSVADLETKDIRSRHWERGKLVCKTLETLKGKADERITFSTDACTHLGQSGTKYLLFLDQDESRWPPSKEPTVVYAINLDQPATELSSGVAYTKAGAILRTSKDILDLAKESLAANAKRHLPPPQQQVDHPERALHIDAPGAAEQALWAGSATLLVVPPDPEFKAIFLKAFRSPHGLDDGIISLCALSFYLDDPEVVAAVKSALSDANKLTVSLRAQTPEHPKAEGITCYPIRQLAYELLVAAGQKPDELKQFCPYFHGIISTPSGGVSTQFRDPKTGHTLSFDEVKTPPATATRPAATLPNPSSRL